MFDHCMYFNTMALGRQLERLWTQAFKPFDLTPSQGFMLRAILNRPGMLQSELADTLRIARATTTRALDGLEKRGLVERRSTPKDGRECEIYPTEEAVPLQAGLNAASGQMTTQLKARVGADVFRDFVEQSKFIGGSL